MVKVTAKGTAMAQLVLASGLRRREFTYLLVHEVPPLPAQPTVVPVPLPVAAAIAKGRKQRTTWVSYEALTVVHRYIGLERPLVAQGSSWRPDPALGEPLVVTRADWHGATINGRRVAWSRLGSEDRLRLVDPGGGSLLLALRGDGGPFLDWATVFRRASDRIRARFEPRFPHVHPHRRGERAVVAGLRSPSRAFGQLEYPTPPVRRLDTARVFRDAYEQAGRQAGLDPAVLAEVDAEFADDLDLGLGEVSG